MILILDSNSMQESLFYGRVIFDLSFFFLVIIIIIQNLVFGVIISPVYTGILIRFVIRIDLVWTHSTQIGT